MVSLVHQEVVVSHPFSYFTFLAYIEIPLLCRCVLNIPVVPDLYRDL